MIRLYIPFALVLVSLTAAAADNGAIERVEVRGRSLEDNLSGDSPVRDVAVYLPPSYASEPDRRYPVVYMLHGFTDSMEKWWFKPDHWINLPTVLDKAMARDDTSEVIVVMPDAFTRFHGSFYSSAATTGDWETYVSEELVAYVDSHYRTLAQAASRGLAGHSMGGYGTIRIGIKRPDVFSSLYSLNPCCLSAGFMDRLGGDSAAAWEDIKTDEDFAAAPFPVKAVFSSAAAWAPNPKNPPFFFDLPTKDSAPQPAVIAKMAANAPLANIDQQIAHLRSLRAIAFDAGDKEPVIAPTVRTLHSVLEDYDIEHEFSIYEGNHINRVAERIETKVMPFFSTHLRFE